MTEVNVALIGYAFMGRAHSNAYRQVTPSFSPRVRPRMKVICGRSRTKVAAAARQFGWEESATDWEAVVRRKDIDVVDIVTPGDLHAPIAIAAARAGKVVFCEKPLANTVAEAERMLAAVEKAGVLHMICHNYRRVPAVMLAKQLIDAGKLGEIRHYRATYLQDWVADPKFPLVWRLDRTRAGSGALGDLAAHSIDLGRFLVGEIAKILTDAYHRCIFKNLGSGRRSVMDFDDRVLIGSAGARKNACDKKFNPAPILWQDKLQGRFGRRRPGCDRLGKGDIAVER